MSNDQPQGGFTPPGEEPQRPGEPEGGPPAEVPSLLARLIGVITAPGVTFQVITRRPRWADALALYLVLVAASSLAYSLNVDWVSMMRNQMESSTMWQFVTSVAGEEQLAEIERASLNEITSLGRGGMALNTVLQSVFGTAVVFHFMLILFVTLFYLMGALADLKLGRVYLDGLLCLLVLILSAILGALVRGLMGVEAREALPYQAGISSIFFIGYVWLLHRSIERQQDLKRMAAAYSHSMAIPGLAALILTAIALLKSEPLTVPGDQVVTSSLGAILGQTSGVLGVLLGALDLFTLWGLTVMAIGFSAASRLSMGTSAAITFLPWGFYVMARLALAAASG